MTNRPNFSFMCCEDCGFPMTRALVEIEAYVAQLESTIHRLEAKCAEPPRDFLSANTVTTCRTSPAARDISPCVQIVTTRIDESSPATAEDEGSGGDSETSSPVATNRRRSTVFAALPVDCGRRRSNASHTSLDHFQSFMSGEFHRDSPNSRRKREAASVTLAVPDHHESTADGLSIPDNQSIEPLIASSAAAAHVNDLLLPEWNSDPLVAMNDPHSGNDVTWAVVSDKEVQDKGTQFTITIRANASSQTVPIVFAMENNNWNGTNHNSAVPTPPAPREEMCVAHFARPTPEASSLTKTPLPCHRGRSSEGSPLHRASSFPSCVGHASLYEVRRANRISSISSNSNNL
jgi:hypothetical protein